MFGCDTVGGKAAAFQFFLPCSRKAISFAFEASQPHKYNKNMSRSLRRTIASDTLAILKAGKYANAARETVHIGQAQKKAEKNTVLYTPEALDRLLDHAMAGDEETKYRVVHSTTLDAARALVAEGSENPFVLNFASAKNPGGGFLGGSQAQEESLARSSGLYPCLLEARPYYDTHRSGKSCFYTDHMIYSPEVPVIKDEKGELLDDAVLVSFLTSAAVNTGVVKRQEQKRIDQIEDAMRLRIQKVLTVAVEHGHETLVLGAWGCGVFQNDPKVIARLFKEALHGPFVGCFREVVFAVYSRNERFITPFFGEFGGR